MTTNRDPGWTDDMETAWQSAWRTAAGLQGVPLIAPADQVPAVVIHHADCPAWSACIGECDESNLEAVADAARYWQEEAERWRAHALADHEACRRAWRAADRLRASGDAYSGALAGLLVQAAITGDHGGTDPAGQDLAGITGQ